MDDKYYELHHALDILYAYTLMADAKIWSFRDRLITLDGEDFYEVIILAIESCFDFIGGRYKDETDEYSYYFSDPCFMDYYRLCREYGRRRGIKLKDNPYMRRAKRFVDGRLSGPYTCWHRLHTKIHHERASGLLFIHTCDFCYELQLLERLLEIRQFYLDGVEELKAELAKPTALAVITPLPAPLRMEEA
jgi:hypothetical protein